MNADNIFTLLRGTHTKGEERQRVYVEREAGGESGGRGGRGRGGEERGGGERERI